MWKLRTKAKLIAVWLFILCAAAIPAIAQRSTKGITIELSISNTELSRSTKPVATITVRNESGSALSLEDFTFFQLKLRADPLPNGTCRFGECYSASLNLTDRKIADGESHVFAVRLDKLHWHNSISSVDTTLGKNLFTEVPAGSYELQATLQRREGISKSGEPTYFTVNSNILRQIKLKRRK